MNPGRPSFARAISVAAMLSLTFVGSFWLFARANDFPAYYHEDEPTKAEQVRSDERNYNHPQLLLEVSRLAARVLRTPKELQAAVEVGRSASAGLAALGAVAAAALGYRLGGIAGLLLGAAAVGTCPALLVYAHYMKEDAALAMGVCLTVLASHVYWRRRERGVDVPALCLLGAACGLTASAKYAGAFALAASIPLVLFAERASFTQGSVRVLVLVASALAVFAAVNHRALAEPARAASRVAAEYRHATTHHAGVTTARPTAFHAVAAARQCMPHALAAAGALLLAFVARPAGTSGWTWFVLFFTGGYLALVSFSVLPYYRYALPVVVLVHVLMVVAVTQVALTIRSERARAAFVTIAALAVLALQLPRCLDFDGQFASDSRERLRLWAMQNLPADAVLVEDGYIALDQPFDPRTGIRARPDFLLYAGGGYESGFAPGAGALDHLRTIGVEYVAVTDFCYSRYLDPGIRPARGTEGVFEYRGNWYRELFRDHQLVWSSAPAHPTYSQFNNPEIRLYRLRSR